MPGDVSCGGATFLIVGTSVQMAMEGDPYLDLRSSCNCAMSSCATAAMNHVKAAVAVMTYHCS